MNNAPVVYLPPDRFLKEMYSADEWYERAPWEERTSARFEAFWSTKPDAYSYGKGAGVRTYVPTPMPAWVVSLKIATETMVDNAIGIKSDLSLCFLNRYEHQHQHLGWHADDGDNMDYTMPIVVQSWGAERELWFRPYGKGGPEHIQKQLLEEGSTLIMLPGMQETHQHKIPKHDQPCGRRISLTWRALK